MIRLVLAACLLTVIVAAPAVDAQTIAAQCPTYVVQVQRARASLVGGDRSGAIDALREAQVALAECIRRESDNAGAPVMLACTSSCAL